MAWSESLLGLLHDSNDSKDLVSGPLRDLGLRVPRAYFNGLHAPKGKLPCSRAPLHMHCFLFRAPGPGLGSISQNS